MRPADQIFDETFLELRAKLLEVAATLDRIDRAAEDGESLSTQTQLRRDKIDQAIQICSGKDPDRAEQLQKLFSREYESDWRIQMQI